MIHRLGRPARLALVSVLPACDSFLIRRPIGRYRATSKIEGSELRGRASKPTASAHDRTWISFQVHRADGSRGWTWLYLSFCCGDTQHPILGITGESHSPLGCV